MSDADDIKDFDGKLQGLLLRGFRHWHLKITEQVGEFSGKFLGRVVDL